MHSFSYYKVVDSTLIPLIYWEDGYIIELKEVATAPDLG